MSYSLQEFIGNSGCDIKLIQSKNKSIIRKISSSIEYNERFNLQIEKQSKFSNSIIKAPIVYNTGYIDGLLYCDMEYINGLKLSQFANINSFDDTLIYFNIILDFIANNFNGSTFSPQHEIINKLNQVLKSVSIDIKITDYIKNKSSISIQGGYCHGDLTFENILVYNNELYLIDFLDSYLDSPIIDISKIYQDLILNWSNRMERDNNFLSSVRNYYLKDRLDFFVNNVIKVDNDALSVQKILTLARILPYAKNESMYFNVSNKLSQLI